MNLAALTSSLGTINAALATITAIAAIAMSRNTFRSGNQLFSQTRTKRLYEIMKLKDQGWRSISSGALQLAVKEAFGIRLAGDEIRFIFERDDALSLFRSREYAGSFVKSCPIEARYKDNRYKWLRRWTFRGNFKVLLVSSIIIYFLTFLPAQKMGTVSTPAAVMLMIVGTILTFTLMYFSRGAKSADTLIKVESQYPRPLYGFAPETKKRANKFPDNTRKANMAQDRKTSRAPRRTSRSARRNEPAAIA
ncbi:hypothetical protein L0Y93_14245 [Burkholderia multivorans]|uniref:hypothetical protein n=1 Tax=Burkholderia multivorans TaxID=87883 RepID=UPI00207CFB25|nr:hypothetical protein [Burkholderia multivorans]MCO1462742.1 hypothetical protein [Burkholderia multivorans]